MNKFNLKTKIAISLSLVFTSFATNAQQTVEQAPNKSNSPVNSISPQVQNATNPFGSVAPQSQPSQVSQQINYSGENNVEKGQQIVVPPKIEKALNAQGQLNLPNPAQSQQEMMGTVPSTPPTGLPQDYNSSNSFRRQSGGGNDQVESMMNILNTPNSKIRELNRDMYDKGRVINEGPVTAPKSSNGVIVAHISPGSTSPVIRLYKNRTSTIIVTDMTGQPWPILNFDGLSSEDFQVKRLDAPAPDGYVLSVTPKASFVSGNLVLILKGLPTPLNVEFVSAQKDVDTTTEIRVQAKGPNAKFSTIGLPQSADSSLLSVLQGVAPQSAKPLKVNTPAVQAWLAKDGSMYLRTRYKIMSPAFDNVTSSPDGTFAYKMVPVPVVLYKVADGRFGEFTVDGF